MQTQFRPLLDAACRKQSVVLKPPERKGISLTEQNLGQVQLSAVRHQTVGAAGPVGDRLEVQGMLMNLSPLRPMAFHVTVETDAATYADWHVPRLDMLKSTPLPAQNVVKSMEIAASAVANAAAARGYGPRPPHVPRPHPLRPGRQRRSSALDFRPTAQTGVWGGERVRRVIILPGRSWLTGWKPIPHSTGSIQPLDPDVSIPDGPAVVLEAEVALACKILQGSRELVLVPSGFWFAVVHWSRSMSTICSPFSTTQMRLPRHVIRYWFHCPAGRTVFFVGAKQS